MPQSISFSKKIIAALPTAKEGDINYNFNEKFPEL